ncbi:MAG TPA: hypothetical protein VKV22_14175 [Rhodanobacteraceae bacterium]|nr:hypothetical protein [Rhodanobacteraceae bacterium]
MAVPLLPVPVMRAITVKVMPAKQAKLKSRKLFEQAQRRVEQLIEGSAQHWQSGRCCASMPFGLCAPARAVLRSTG